MKFPRFRGLPRNTGSGYVRHYFDGREAVPCLEGDVGSSVEFKTLAVSPDEGDLVAGAAAESAKVTATITKHGRGKKIIVYKFKRRKMYRRKNGHRQTFTQVKIDEIAV